MHLLRRLLNTGYVGARLLIEERVPFSPIERIHRFQRFRVRSIVRHACTTVPFYRESMKQLGLGPEDFRGVDDVSRLPLVDDLLVRNDPSRFASNRYTEDSRLTIYTSGTTSHVQKKIYWDHAALLDRLACTGRDRAVLSALFGRGWGERQLYVFPPDSATLAVRTFWDATTLVPRRVADRRFIPVAAPAAEVLQAINTFRPSVVFSYGSYADFFFRWLSDTKRQIAAPRVWMYGADMLSEGAREMMQQLGCVPYTTYQAGETGRIGFECEQRCGFHLNVDMVAVRIIGGDGRDVPPGTVGEIVVSNLHNRAMVLLNYRIGDLGALATGLCRCGRSLPLLEKFEGRRTDLLRLPDGRVVSAVLIEMCFKDELKEAIQAQVAQSSPKALHWRGREDRPPLLQTPARGAAPHADRTIGPETVARRGTNVISPAADESGPLRVDDRPARDRDPRRDILGRPAPGARECPRARLGTAAAGRLHLLAPLQSAPVLRNEDQVARFHQPSRGPDFDGSLAGNTRAVSRPRAGSVPRFRFP